MAAPTNWGGMGGQCPHRGCWDGTATPWGQHPGQGGNSWRWGVCPAPQQGLRMGLILQPRGGGLPPPHLGGTPHPPSLPCTPMVVPPALLLRPGRGRQDHPPLCPRAPPAPLPTAPVLPGTSACSPAPRGEGPGPSRPPPPPPKGGTTGETRSLWSSPPSPQAGRPLPSLPHPRVPPAGRSRCPL